MTHIEKIYDVTTGDESIRQYTAEEVAIVEAAKEAAKAEKLQRENELATKEAARQAVLSKLGLTAEEAAALLT
jgi:hypothetical protein